MSVILIVLGILVIFGCMIALTAGAISVMFPIIFAGAIWFLVKHIVQEIAPTLNPLFEGALGAITLIIVIGLVIL